MDTVPPDFTDPFVSRYLAGFAVLALEGDLKARDFFIKRMTLMTETDWGIHNFPTENGLGDTFCIRPICGRGQGETGRLTHSRVLWKNKVVD